MIQSTYHSITNLEARFTSTTHLTTLNRTITNHGIIYLQPPGKIRIEYQGDTPRHYISDGKSLWIYTPKDGQIIHNSLEQSGIPSQALAFIGGFGKLTRLFRVKQLKDSRSIDTDTYLHLIPKKRSNFSALDTTFNQQGLLTDLTIYNHSGGKVEYHFKQIRINHQLPSKLFTPKQ